MTITKKGNAVGFTSKGETVSGQYRAKAKAWYVSVTSEMGVTMMTDPRNRNFATVSEAQAYAETLIDAAKTEELAWW